MSNPWGRMSNDLFKLTDIVPTILSVLIDCFQSLSILTEWFTTIYRHKTGNKSLRITLPRHIKYFTAFEETLFHINVIYSINHQPFVPYWRITLFNSLCDAFWYIFLFHSQNSLIHLYHAHIVHDTMADSSTDTSIISPRAILEALWCHRGLMS